MKVRVTTTYNKKCVNYATTYNDKLMRTNKADSAVLKEKHIAASDIISGTLVFVK